MATMKIQALSGMDALSPVRQSDIIQCEYELIHTEEGRQHFLHKHEQWGKNAVGWLCMSQRKLMVALMLPNS